MPSPQSIDLPSEVRRALLADHSRIARLLVELEELARRVRGGDHTSGHFHAVAHQLHRMLDDHNRAEEDALVPILATVDAWGGVRIDRMLSEHREEHERMLATLATRDAAALALLVPAFIADLRAHMAHEEATFLSGEVLRDDVITAGPTS